MGAMARVEAPQRVAAPAEGAAEILLEVVDAMTTAAGVDDALNRLAALALRATGADRCAILTRDPTGYPRLIPAAGAARVGDPRAQWRRFRAMEPIDVTSDPERWALWDSTRTVAIDDAPACPFIPPHWKREWGTKSLAFASIRARGMRFGLLAVDYVQDFHTFTQEEQDLLDAIAGAAGMALSMASLVERMQKAVESERLLSETLRAQLRVIEALQELSGVVVRTSDLKAVLRALNRGICSEVGLRCVRVGFSDPVLAGLLGTSPLRADDLTLLAERRRLRSREPVVRGERLWVPVPIERRFVGLLTMACATEPGVTEIEVAKAVAAGLGEVAFKAKLRRTSERRAREVAVAEERERIARDLHDTVGQTFYGIGLKLDDVLADVDDPALAARLQELRGLAARAVADVRSAVYALSFLHVRAKGLIASLRALARQFTRATGVLAELRVEGTIPHLHEETESALYRMAHEALVNVDRHARASGVVVTLSADPGRVRLAIRDDGVGLDQRQAADWRSAAHFGMRTMARAIEEVGGTFRVGSPAPRGLLVEALVPASVRPRSRPAAAEQRSAS